MDSTWKRTISTLTVVLTSRSSVRHTPTLCSNPISPYLKASQRAQSAMSWKRTKRTGLCANHARHVRQNPRDLWQPNKSRNKRREIRSPKRSWLADRIFRSSSHRSNRILRLLMREKLKNLNEKLQRSEEMREKKRSISALANVQIDQAMHLRDLWDLKLWAKSISKSQASGQNTANRIQSSTKTSQWISKKPSAEMKFQLKTKASALTRSKS